MKVTNKYNVPETLMTLATREFYSKGASQYSVTELLSPPRIRRLREQYDEKMVEDVSDGLWSLLGSALHVVMERSITEGYISEERLFANVDEVTISGQIDVQKETPEGLVIIDYKMTSAWSVMVNKPEWEQQLNVYKWLVETVKKRKVVGLQICAFIRDFSNHDARENYPKAPIHMVDIPMWDAVKTESYVRERLEEHRNAKMFADFGEELPLCSDEERWMRETVYAVKRDGRKTAIKLFKSIEEANELAEKEKGYVETRKGEFVRCTGNYCGVAQWCSQYQGEINESA
jgi:PD-(D/E)XK nuclease superfamily